MSQSDSEENITALARSVGQLLSRMDNIERLVDSSSEYTRNRATSPQSRSRATSVQPDQATHSQNVGQSLFSSHNQVSSQYREAPRPGVGSADTASVDYQAEYSAIKDSVQAVRLPADQKLQDSRTGIRRQDQGTYNNLARSARYTETALKLLSTLDEPPQDPHLAQCIQSLFIVNLAHMRYLQDEYSALLVQGTINQETARIYRAFRRNTSGLTPEAITSLQQAASIVSAANQSNNSTSDRPRGRGRGRGGNFVRRDNWVPRPDSPWTARQTSQFRVNDQQNSATQNH